MRTSVVTGCNGGMGRAIVAELRRAGDRVVGPDRDEASAAPSPAQTPDRYISCDLADMEAVRGALRLLAQEDGIGCLVNCAGLYEKKAVFDLTLEDFDRVLAVNLRAPFLLSQELARAMAARGGGAIVNIASINGKLGSPMVPYGTSKAGLIGLTRSLARTLAPYNIRVNAIAPGLVRTPMSRRAQQNPEILERMKQKQPLAQGLMEPEDIARAALFLLSPESSMITGQVLGIDAGWSLR